MYVSDDIAIPDSDIQMIGIRAQGAGGQHVNKVSSAIHLRFDIRASSLPDECKKRLLNSLDNRINGDGVIVIKAQQFRSQERNKEDALIRLKKIIEDSLSVQKVRKPMRRSKASIRKRLEHKNKRSSIKSLRKREFWGHNT